MKRPNADDKGADWNSSRGCFGMFGYELDLSKLTMEEREIVKSQVGFAKRYRKLMMTGDFYRLKSPFKENDSSGVFVLKGKKREE